MSQIVLRQPLPRDGVKALLEVNKTTIDLIRLLPIFINDSLESEDVLSSLIIFPEACLPPFTEMTLLQVSNKSDRKILGA